jgi:hypothetical protein
MNIIYNPDRTRSADLADADGKEGEAVRLFCRKDLGDDERGGHEVE